MLVRLLRAQSLPEHVAQHRDGNSDELLDRFGRRENDGAHHALAVAYGSGGAFDHILVAHTSGLEEVEVVGTLREHQQRHAEEDATHS
ncbi:hypothetical protein DVH05_010788 [Phytophthora capsici]|nr:hypothetical protein DVH05_010788 [Phytophthora capsici]